MNNDLYTYFSKQMRMDSPCDNRNKHRDFNMIKFDILNRFSDDVQFTAEIDCKETDLHEIKIGLAVRWAIKNGTNLYGASLDGANLVRANLDGANLDGAKLDGANLYGASLVRANLEGASLVRANLEGASLVRASLVRASLDGASLDGANLVRANLYGASLDGANLDGANLYGASLVRANLEGANGINDYIKCIQIETYPITYTSDVLQIGCERHLISEWAEFDSARIVQMDGKPALIFWKKYKDWIFQTIDLSPAKPTCTNGDTK